MVKLLNFNLLNHLYVINNRGNSDFFYWVLGKLPPSRNSNANLKPNPEPDRGAIFRTPFYCHCFNILSTVYSND